MQFYVLPFCHMPFGLISLLFFSGSRYAWHKTTPKKSAPAMICLSICLCTYVADLLDFAASFTDDTSRQALVDQNAQINFAVVL